MSETTNHKINYSLWRDFRMCERAAEMLNNLSGTEVSLRVAFRLYSNGRVSHATSARLGRVWLAMCVRRSARCTMCVMYVLKRKIVKEPKWLHCDFKLVPLWSVFSSVFFVSFRVRAGCVVRPPAGCRASRTPKYTFRCVYKPHLWFIKKWHRWLGPNGWMASKPKYFRWGHTACDPSNLCWFSLMH